MEDIAPELYERIKSTYENEKASSKKLDAFLEKVKKGNAAYEDVYDYAGELGRCLESAFSHNISDDVLPDSRMYYNIAKRIIEPMLKKSHDDIAAQCSAVQHSLNKKAGIGLNAVKPEYDKARTEAIINYVCTREKYSSVEKSFLDGLSNNCRKTVDDSVKQNADFHYKSGLSPRIVRICRGKACKWCREVEGSYNYKDVRNTGNNVFRRHANCTCTVSYDPGDGSKKIQDVYSKRWQNQDAFQERKRFYLENRVDKKRLTDMEQYAVNSHISSDFYIINDCLRNGYILNQEQNALVKNLDSALEKLDSYKGRVSRSVQFYSSSDLDKFLSDHEPGQTVTYKDFTSSTASKELYTPDGQVQMFWTSRRGRNLIKYNKKEQEILYKRNSSFIVLEKRHIKGVYYIFMEEL